MKYLFILIACLCSLPSQAQQALEKKMVLIPAGYYQPFFKTPTNLPVRVEAFMLDATAVTNLEFLEFVKANPQWQRSKVNRLFADTNYLKHWKSDLEIGEHNKEIYHSPVVHVSWFAAKAYAKWKNKRLPTVEEWEMAAKGKPRNVDYTSLTDYILAWYSKPNLPVLPNIKSTFQNEYGLYDMHGLIWEWTFNFNSFVGAGDGRGNTVDEIQAFCAAGTINVNDRSDLAGYMRFSYRGSLKGHFCIANLGFRCAKDVKP